MKEEKAQITMTDEVIVDNFAGGGGASTGIELATGREVSVAINHDPDAIRLHKTNHPYTRHVCESVWEVDPVEITGGRPVGLAWFSPDCKHFSRAKGGVPVKKEIRGLSWVILRWALRNPPRVIMMENVPEIRDWGPLKLAGYDKDGKEIWCPDPKRKGETFDAFIGMLSEGVREDHPAIREACEFLKIDPEGEEAQRLIGGLGYDVKWWLLVAADLGAPTTRKRFALVARNDGRPIVRPKRTHAPQGSAEVQSGKLQAWRPAAEIIDWGHPMYSIFETKQEIREKYGATVVRPLAENTLRRIIRGVDKYTIKSGKPFLVECNHSGAGHVYDAWKPIGTVTAHCTEGLCEPILSPATFSNTGGSTGEPADKPVPTVRTGGGIGLAAASLMQYHTEQQEEETRGQMPDEPIRTIDGANRFGLISAHLTEYYGNGKPISPESPLHTVTGHDREALCGVHVVKYYGGIIGSEAGAPLPTVTAIDHNALAAAHIVEFKGKNNGQDARFPLRTITAGGGEFAVCEAVVMQYVPAPGADFGHWDEVRKLLNRFCGYDLAEDEIILLRIGGAWYFIRDILLRMLTPKELYRAMDFPEDYQFERDYTGREYPRSKQVEKCGNAVPPSFAAALVRANMPEWCHGKKIGTMEEFREAVAV